MPKKEQVRQMFDNIAGDYDRLNHIMSLDTDKSWRRRALGEIAAAPGGREGEIDVLDLACGTGDFSIAIAKGVPGSRVTGVDLSEGMLEVMRKKVAEEGLESRIEARQGDGEALPFPDGSFDRVTIAFGIRNFENREKGLREMLRVLRPGGKLVILELSVPENRLIRWAYNLYFLHILPKIGGGISGDKAAYNYLPASVTKFPGRKAFMATLKDCGYANVCHKAFTFGICRMYCGEKLQ